MTDAARSISRDEELAIAMLELLARYMPDPLRGYVRRITTEPAFEQDFYEAWWPPTPNGFLVDWYDTARAISGPDQLRRIDALADIRLYGYDLDEYRRGMPATGLWERSLDARIVAHVRELATSVASARRRARRRGGALSELTECIVKLPLHLLMAQARGETEFFRGYDKRSWTTIAAAYASSG